MFIKYSYQRQSFMVFFIFARKSFLKHSKKWFLSLSLSRYYLSVLVLLLLSYYVHVRKIVVTFIVLWRDTKMTSSMLLTLLTLSIENIKEERDDDGGIYIQKKIF